MVDEHGGIGFAEKVLELIDEGRWKLIQMALPRLQMMGRSHRSFIYEIHWTEQVRRTDVGQYPVSRETAFDNRVLLRANVGAYLSSSMACSGP